MEKETVEELLAWKFHCDLASQVTLRKSAALKKIVPRREFTKTAEIAWYFQHVVGERKIKKIVGEVKQKVLRNFRQELCVRAKVQLDKNHKIKLKY